jgi:hypothetical protein
MIPLEGAWAQQGASAEVTYIGENRVILVAENMPSMPENRTCQIWVIHDDVPTPAGRQCPHREGGRHSGHGRTRRRLGEAHRRARAPH